MTDHPPPSVKPPVTVTIRERHLEERANYEGMDDDDLAFEAASLAENIESTRTELRLEQSEQVERPHGWQVRAQRALAVLKGRAALCKVEINRRRKFDAEQQAEKLRVELEQSRLERERRRAAHEEFLRVGQERKQAKIATATEKRRQYVKDKSERFVRHAGAMLPKETFEAIWAAVNAEESDD